MAQKISYQKLEDELLDILQELSDNHAEKSHGKNLSAWLFDNLRTKNKKDYFVTIWKEYAPEDEDDKTFLQPSLGGYCLTQLLKMLKKTSWYFLYIISEQVHPLTGELVSMWTITLTNK